MPCSRCSKMGLDVGVVTVVAAARRLGRWRDGAQCRASPWAARRLCVASARRRGRVEARASRGEGVAAARRGPWATSWLRRLRVGAGALRRRGEGEVGDADTEGLQREAVAAALRLLGEGAMRVPGRGACSPGDGGCAHGSPRARAHQQWWRLGNGGGEGDGGAAGKGAERRLRGFYTRVWLGHGGLQRLLGVRASERTRGAHRRPCHGGRGCDAGVGARRALSWGWGAGAGAACHRASVPWLAGGGGSPGAGNAPARAGRWCSCGLG